MAFLSMRMTFLKRTHGVGTSTKLWLFSLTLCLVCSLTPACAGTLRKVNTKSQVSVRISTSKNQFKVGELIRLRIQLSNEGTSPILIPNSISTARGTPAHIEFELRDSRDRASPVLEATLDSFSIPTPRAPATALLGSWLVLNSGYSLVTNINIDKSFLSFLGRPGRYKLTGKYFASGLLYPPTFQQLGITEDDVKSLPYGHWSGNILTNTVNVKIVSAGSSPK
jgi:hypothetical protein